MFCCTCSPRGYDLGTDQLSTISTRSTALENGQQLYQVIAHLVIYMCVIQGADPIVEASTGHTALTWAAVCGFDLVAAELLNGNTSKTNSSGSSTLGSMHDAIDAVTKSTVVEGKTALHNAAFNGNSKVVVLLLDRLRDLLLTDRFVDSSTGEGAVGKGNVACIMARARSTPTGEYTL